MISRWTDDDGNEFVCHGGGPFGEAVVEKVSDSAYVKIGKTLVKKSTAFKHGGIIMPPPVEPEEIITYPLRIEDLFPNPNAHTHKWEPVYVHDSPMSVDEHVNDVCLCGADRRTKLHRKPSMPESLPEEKEYARARHTSNLLWCYILALALLTVLSVLRGIL